MSLRPCPFCGEVAQFTPKLCDGDAPFEESAKLVGWEVTHECSRLQSTIRIEGKTIEQCGDAWNGIPEDAGEPKQPLSNFSIRDFDGAIYSSEIYQSGKVHLWSVNDRQGVTIPLNILGRLVMAMSD